MNKNLAGGYYIVSLGDVDLLGESVSLAGVAKLLYEAKKHKFVILQDIVMDGEKKTAIPVLFDATMALTTEPEDWDESEDGEFVAEEVYTATIYNVYGKNIAIDAEGGASVTDYTTPIDVSTIEAGNIDQNAILGFNSDNELVKGNLLGKFVRVMGAPASVRLTPEEREAVEQGVFINGDFRGFHNPIITPVNADGRGLIIGTRGINEDGEITTYKLWPHESTNPDLFEIPDISLIEFSYNNGYILTIKGGRLYLSGVWINNKIFPNYPTDQTDKSYHFVLDNGTLAWHEGNGLYLHTIVFNVSGGSTITIRIVSDSATACALDSVSGNFVIAGATCLIPSNMGNAVLTPFDANGFNPDIHLFDSATGAYSTAVTLASVESDTITPIG